GTKLLSVTISGGVATANFDGNLEKGADSSCKVLGIREQITQTLKQFPTVTSVIIQSNGDANILQP
ncbi:MAG TPA: GerMN domain-containing protein, partial [Flavobacterium sp.]|nr:GerMN domain-containing protein [Flavobacterium sp.]